MGKSIKRKAAQRAVHASRVHAKKSRTAVGGTNTETAKFARVTILGLILIAAVTVLIAVFSTIFTTSLEDNVRGKIKVVAENYYKNYFYGPLAAKANKSMGDILERYEMSGLSSVSIWQILHYSEEKYPKEAEMIREFCDENASEVVFYPKSPFQENDFTIDYRLSCEF